jgi:HEAT repeat protein
LPNPDPEIRRAALAAVLEFGDRSAMPALEEALEVNSDPQEKAGIQKAIEYLQLPSFDERDSAGSAALPAGASSIPAAN